MEKQGKAGKSLSDKPAYGKVGVKITDATGLDTGSTTSEEEG